MSQENTHNDNLRTVFANPWVWLVTHCVFPLLSLLSVSYCAWLLWEMMPGDGKTASAIAIGALAGIIALSAGATLWFRRSRVPIWFSVGGAAAGMAYLVGYAIGLQADVLVPQDTPDWMISESHTMLVFAGMMPMLFTDIWRVATLPLPLSPARDKFISFASAVAVPVGGFMLMFVASIIMDSFYHVDRILFDRIRIFFGITFFSIIPILFFLALFRALMWLRIWIKSRNAQNQKRGGIATTILVAFALPLGGLILNAVIPFPADFQSPWVYALTVLNGAVLLVGRSRPGKPDDLSRLAGTAAPHHDSPSLTGGMVFFLRYLTFPFTLYFFLVFLPFFPLSILAMIAFGAGFLILAPIFLFWRHVNILVQDWRALALPALHKTIIALVAVAVMPGTIVINAYNDRLAFRELLDYAFSPDITRDATFPTTPERALRILERADAFKNQSETPIISAIYTQIVFDGMVLPDRRFDFMWDCYVGGEKPDTKFDNWGGMFSRNDATRRTRGWRTAPPRGAVLESGDVDVAVSTNNFEQTITLTLRITTKQDLDQEFYAPVILPSATWVTGMRLKIDGVWEDSAIVERRAAEWVYRQITEVERRDPAILTLDTPERGLLRVFPVSRNLPRDLEITFLQPVGLHGEIKIGDTVFQINTDDAVWPDWWPEEYGGKCDHSTWIIVDSSENGFTPDKVREAIIAFQLKLFEKIVDRREKSGSPITWDTNEFIQKISERFALLDGETIIISANAETKTTPGLYLYEESELGTADMFLPNRFGLDAVRAIRQLEYGVRMKEDDCFREDMPYMNTLPHHVVFVGNRWEEILPTISTKDYGVLQKCTIVNSDGKVIDFEFQENNLAENRFSHEHFFSIAPAHLHWTQGAELWKFQQECYDNGTLNTNFRKILSDSSRTGILVPQTAYIVVENEAQRKMLKVKQLEAAGAHTAFDFDYDTTTTDAPGLLLLLAGAGVWWFLRKRRPRIAN